MDLSLDLSRVEASKSSSDLVPPGEYEVRIAGTEYKETSKGNGSYLRIRYKIIDGPMAGRSIFDNLNLWHKTDQTRLIAQSQLKAIAKAINHPNPNFIRNTEELIGGALKIRVIVNGDYNDVKSYKGSELQPVAPQAPQPAAPVAPQTPPPPPTAVPAATGAATPWG